MSTSSTGLPSILLDYQLTPGQRDKVQKPQQAQQRQEQDLVNKLRLPEFKTPSTTGEISYRDVGTELS